MKQLLSMAHGENLEREKKTAVSSSGSRALAAQLIAVQEAERQRIARELHDDFTQRLVLVGRELRSLAKQSQQPSADLQAHIERLADQVDEMSRDLNHMSRNLHPLIIHDLGLSAAIESECQRFATYNKIQLQHEIDPCPRAIPSLVAVTFFRIAQECFRNITKHARSSSVRLRLKVTSQELLLSITDTGIGFDVDRIAAKGRLGIVSMRERMQLISGNLSIESRPGQGTTVAVVAPFQSGMQFSS